MEDGYPRAMVQGWVRTRWVALTSAGCATLALASRLTLELGQREQSAEPWRVVQPDLYPGLPIPVLMAAMVLLVVGALLGATIGVAAVARRSGRILGAGAAVVSLLALFVWW